MTDLSTDDFFASLEAEIALTIKKDKIKADREKDRRASLNTRLDPATRAVARANFLEARALLDADLWKSVSLTALFAEQQCDGCGSVHRIFSHYMERQLQPKKPSNKRWVKTTAPKFDLPRETMTVTSITHVCADCCGEHGFSFTGATVRTAEPVVPAWDYQQEDINAQG